MRIVSLVVGVALCAAVGCGSSGNPEAEKLAEESAAQWLQLIDNEDYAGSWESAASLFKSAVNSETWEQNARSAREPLGAVVSRRIQLKTYATTLPGAPDGQYVVIQYDTAFEKKGESVETVTPMRDNDGTWRVSGYYVK